MKYIMQKLLAQQNGQILLYVLLILLFGSLVITPVLAHMDTGVLAGQSMEQRIEELYAADSGIQDAIWQVKQPTPDPLKVPAEVGPEFALTYDINNIDAKGTDVEVRIEVITPLVPGDLAYEVRSRSTGITGIQANIVSHITIPAGANMIVFEGALVSSNDITLKKDAYIDGDVICAREFDAQGAFSHPPDNISENADMVFPSDSENLAFAQKYKDEALLGGTINGNYNISSSGNFGPKYINGNLTTKKDITINLLGTIYVNGTIDIGKDAIITGNGSIVAVGIIGFEKVAGFGTDGEAVIFSLNGYIDFRKEANIDALIYAPNGDISFKKEADILGAVICGGSVTVADITADKEFKVVYNPIYADTFELPGFSTGTVLIEAWSINP